MKNLNLRTIFPVKKVKIPIVKAKSIIVNKLITIPLITLFLIKSALLLIAPT